MKPIATAFLVACLLSLGNASLAAQSLTADQFLQRVSAHPVGDQGERDQARETAVALDAASRANVENQLPGILAHATSNNEAAVRQYAAGFLLMIALRPDGAEMLSPSSAQVAALLLDANPAVQGIASAITDYVISHSRTNRKPYLAAMETAIQRPQTPQDACINIIAPLLLYASGQPGAVRSVLGFMQRPDLTRSTRQELVHSLGSRGGLPQEVNKALVRELDDRDPAVRIAAVVAFADSTTDYHALARDRVAQMTIDAKEDPRVRELAKEAMAGQTHLDPNVGLPPPENLPPGPN